MSIEDLKKYDKLNSSSGGLSTRAKEVSTQGELSDEDLDSISGGSGSTTSAGESATVAAGAGVVGAS